MSGLRVALDGPGSSGKSSVGAAAAAALGYRFLDTGVLYRAITLMSVLHGVAPDDGERLAALVPQVRILADADGALRRAAVGEQDVTDQLHVPEVDRRVSAVSAQPAVRAALLDLQRQIAADGHIILAGRDIGTVVLPDADLKLYLDVSVEERAQRRTAERGLAPDSAEARSILEDLRRRDHLDASRAVAPMRVPADAVIVRSDGRRFEDTVAQVVAIIQAREAGEAHPGATPGTGDAFSETDA